MNDNKIKKYEEVWMSYINGQKKTNGRTNGRYWYSWFFRMGEWRTVGRQGFSYYYFLF